MLAFFLVILQEDVCCISNFEEDFSKNGCTSKIQGNTLSY